MPLLSKICLSRHSGWKAGNVWVLQMCSIHINFSCAEFCRSSKETTFHIDDNNFQDGNALHDSTRGMGNKSGWKEKSLCTPISICFIVKHTSDCVNVSSNSQYSSTSLTNMMLLTGLDSIMLRGAEWIEQVMFPCFTDWFYRYRMMNCSSRS
jgi:hypothetical protein